MLQTEPEIVDTFEDGALTDRQREVLENALDLLVSGGGKALTTAKIARASNCSKESLYKWFGDRNGLLAAMMTLQGSKVGSLLDDNVFQSSEAFKKHLIQFSEELLKVLSSDTSLALNRLAIGEAGDEQSQLGALLIKNGRGLVQSRGHAFLEAAKERGFIKFDDVNHAYRVLYGLVVSDFHVRSLLGETSDMTDKDLKDTAQKAVEQFYQLFGT